MEEHEDIHVQLPLHRSGLAVSSRNTVMLSGASTVTKDDVLNVATGDDGNAVNGVERGCRVCVKRGVHDGGLSNQVTLKLVCFPLENGR